MLASGHGRCWMAQVDAGDHHSVWNDDSFDDDDTETLAGHLELILLRSLINMFTLGTFQ